MSAIDLRGRPYAKIADVKVGSILKPDGDFTCMLEGTKLVVAHDDGLYVPCSVGRHYLSGQVQGDHYLGLYFIEE